MGAGVSLIELGGRLLSRTAYVSAKRFFTRLLSSPADPGLHRSSLGAVSGGVAMYIHIPFCHEPLCRYCCFIRRPMDQGLFRLYRRALLEEVSLLASLAEEASPGSLYIGGGSPSIDPYFLAELIDHVENSFSRVPEVSVEANPRDVDEEFVSILRHRVSRLSIGVQALDRVRLERLGRHNSSPEDSVRAVETARGVFRTLNIDMIWGLPGDTPETVSIEVHRALSLGPDQATFYPLMPPLERDGEGGLYIEDEYRIYKTILSLAARRSYRPRTPWCLDRSEGLVDEYIVEYRDYLAAGPSGIGKAGDYVYVNTASVEKYIEYVSRGRAPVLLSTRMYPREEVLYRIDTALFSLYWSREVLSIYRDLYTRALEALVYTGLGLLGERLGRGPTRISRTETLYLLHSIQRGFFAAVTWFRQSIL